MNKGVGFDSFSAKSDDEHLGVRHDRHSQYGRRMGDMMTDGFESDVRSNVSSSSRVERRKVFAGRDENYVSDARNWDVEVDSFQEKMSNGLPRVRIARDFDDDSPVYCEDEYSRGLEILGDGRRAQRVDHDVIRYQREVHDYESLGQRRYNIDGPSNVGDDDRDELLKQIEELKDQLSRSGSVIENDKEKVPVDRRMVYQDPRSSQSRHPDSHFGMNRAAVQYGYKDSQYIRQSYQNEYDEPPYLMRREEGSGNCFYPSRYAPGHIQGYGDPVQSRLPRGAPYRNSPPYHQSPSHVSAGYANEDMVYRDDMDSYPRSNIHNSRRQVPSNAYSGMYINTPNDGVLVHPRNTSSFGSQDYNQRISNPPPLRSRETPSHNICSSELKSEVDGSISRFPERVQLDSTGTLRRSIAGGAPFLACPKCFELLILPKKGMNKNTTQKKVKCGACSTVIPFAVSKDNLVASTNLVATDTHVRAKHEHHVSSTHENGLLKQGRTEFASDDYDNSEFEFKSMDGERGNRFSDMGNHSSASKYSPERDAVESSSTAIPDPYSIDIEKKDKAPPLPAGSTLQEYFEYSNKFHRVSRPEDGKGSELPVPDHSKEPSKETISRRKESAATEIDFSSNEYSTNTRSSFGSSMNEDYQRGSSRATASNLAGVDEKSPSGSERYSDEKEKDNAHVTVNGHFIPYELILRAQNVAGRIRPGNYWYDARAGFWGVMGGPCLGIIPPSIEEFNYPMPERCSGGNTCVYVNGRELNQKDLKLLCSRGLPVEKDRSYIIEISGNVLDDDTGLELQSLGKLAPSVEKAKRGFGMRPPKTV